MSIVINDNYCIPSIEEIIKNMDFKPISKPKPSNYYNCTWKRSEKDVQVYWAQMKKYIPISTNNWTDFRYFIKGYKDVLVGKSQTNNRYLNNWFKVIKYFDVTSCCSSPKVFVTDYKITRRKRKVGTNEIPFKRNLCVDKYKIVILCTGNHNAALNLM